MNKEQLLEQFKSMKEALMRAAMREANAVSPASEISRTSRARAKLGLLLWGRFIGLSQNGKPVELPAEIFHEVGDRVMPNRNQDTQYAVKQRVMMNLIRAQMVVVEAALVKSFIVAFCFLSFMVGLVWIDPTNTAWYAEHVANADEKAKQVVMGIAVAIAVGIAFISFRSRKS